MLLNIPQHKKQHALPPKKKYQVKNCQRCYHGETCSRWTLRGTGCVNLEQEHTRNKPNLSPSSHCLGHLQHPLLAGAKKEPVGIAEMCICLSPRVTKLSTEDGFVAECQQINNWHKQCRFGSQNKQTWWQVQEWLWGEGLAATSAYSNAQLTEGAQGRVGLSMHLFSEWLQDERAPTRTSCKPILLVASEILPLGNEYNASWRGPFFCPWIWHFTICLLSYEK